MARPQAAAGWGTVLLGPEAVLAAWAGEFAGNDLELGCRQASGGSLGPGGGVGVYVRGEPGRPGSVPAVRWAAAWARR